jgi:sulfoxide reductase heme-binding subunit YedZ
VKIGSRSARIAVAAAGLIPLAHGVFDFATDGLGPEPVEEITHRTGQWALRMLLLGLAVSPARRLLDAPGLVPHRRTFGLLAFLYASLHFITYLALDLDFRLGGLAEDIWERPFITVGFSALVLLTPLALTSTRSWIRRLGKRWRRLHRGVYLAVTLAAIHFVWSAKADWLEPGIYAAIAAGLLGLRIPGALGRKRSNYATLRRAERPEPEGKTP